MEEQENLNNQEQENNVENDIEETKNEENIAGQTENKDISEEAKEEPEDRKEINKQEEKHDKKEKNKKVVPIIIALFVILATMIFSIIFALINMNNDKIFKGISILGIDVSKLTVSEATSKINTAIEERFKDENNNLILKMGENETSVTANSFNAKFDVDSAVIEAYNIGKSGNILTNNYSILFTSLFKKDIKPTLYLDEYLL